MMFAKMVFSLLATVIALPLSDKSISTLQATISNLSAVDNGIDAGITALQAAETAMCRGTGTRKCADKCDKDGFSWRKAEWGYWNYKPDGSRDGRTDYHDDGTLIYDEDECNRIRCSKCTGIGRNMVDLSYHGQCPCPPSSCRAAPAQLGPTGTGGAYTWQSGGAYYEKCYDTANWNADIRHGPDMPRVRTYECDYGYDWPNCPAPYILWPGTYGIKRAFEGSDQKYCSDRGDKIDCTYDGIGYNDQGESWEKFTFERQDDGTWAIRGGRQFKYCTDHDSGVTCNSDSIGQYEGKSWEKFTMEELSLHDKTVYALKGGKNGKYCSASNSEYKLICNSDYYYYARFEFVPV
jgi:hypothetical protein